MFLLNDFGAASSMNVFIYALLKTEPNCLWDWKIISIFTTTIDYIKRWIIERHNKFIIRKFVQALSQGKFVGANAAPTPLRLSSDDYFLNSI